jgi:hypothetical protein
MNTGISLRLESSSLPRSSIIMVALLVMEKHDDAGFSEVVLVSSRAFSICDQE